MLRQEEFIIPLNVSVPDHLRARIAFAQKRVTAVRSEFATCESLIYPVIEEIWRPYADELTLWSHVPLCYDDDLSGTPDYFLARRSPLGDSVQDIPYLLVVEAKKDDFARGWGQCMAAMLAAQKLNELTEPTLYGITTNGRVWEIGRLEATVLTRDERLFFLRNLDELCAALNYIFEQCRLQVSTQPCPM